MTPKITFYRIFLTLFMQTVTCATVPDELPDPESINYATIEEWIRMRCSLDPLATTVVEWSGPVYVLQPQTPQKYIFDVYGINLARCWWNATADSYYFSSRELQYYLDGDSKLPMDSWTNPWTNETVTVEHTANDPVQFNVGKYGYKYDVLSESVASFPETINLFYENPLQCTDDPKYHNKRDICDLTEAEKDLYKPYSNQEFYESTEIFKFLVNEKDLKNENLDSANMHFTWSRFSQIMPWMKSEGLIGSMLFTTTGSKINSDLSTIPDWLKEELDRIPVYKSSPVCYEDSSSSVTSWVYFAQYYEEYLKGEKFPINAEEPECLYDVVSENDRRVFDDENNSGRSVFRGFVGLVAFCVFLNF